MGRNSKAFWHCSITDIDIVQNNVIGVRFTVKSSDRLSRTFIGQDSTPYRKVGEHLARNKLKTTSSEASRPTLPNIALNER